MYFSYALFATAFLTLANGAVLGKRSLSGEATFYGGNLAGGACSFSTYTLPSNILGTALSDSNWDNSGNCGACVSVTGPSGNSITAMIVDECPGCGLNHLDLFPDAFADLANPTTGVIDVTWNYVDCPITSALSVHNKEGVSAYWFSMQVVNANKAVARLDVSTDGGTTWQTTTRRTYNFFENSSGFGTTIVDVKITSVDGDVVIVNDVTVSGGTSTEASSNFGSSGTVGSTVAAIVSSTTSSSPVQPTMSTTPVSAPTTSETPVVDTTTSYPGTNFAETSVSISPTPSTTPTTAVIPTSLAAADGGIVSPTIPPAAPVITEATPTPSSSTAPEVVTAYVDTCEA